jgi:glutamate synthase (NADPH/NADH)
VQVGLLLESGEVNVVHHICVLIGFGLDAVCPYMVYETVARLRSEGLVGAEWDDESVAKSYQKSVDYGMRKVRPHRTGTTTHAENAWH